MDSTDIPVLTKKVQSGSQAAEATVSASPRLSAEEKDALAMHIKQSLLAELNEQWRSQIVDELTGVVSERLNAQAELQRKTLSEYALLVQQSIESDARAHVGDSIHAVESAFREAMTTLGQQQLQLLEEKYQALWQAQQASMAAKAQALNEEMLSALTLHSKQLQLESKKILGNEHAAIESSLAQEYRQSLQQAFGEFAAAQTETFRQKFSADLPGIENALAEKVNALVQAQMGDIEKQLSAQLKARILEVLQGIRFVMPTL